VEPEQFELYDEWECVQEGLYRRVETTTRARVRAWVYIYGRPLPPDAVGPLARWTAPEASDHVRALLVQGDYDG
jgi:hypothetical protein